jgi:HTH-type transcriptional regulator/antitoxin HigA
VTATIAPRGSYAGLLQAVEPRPIRTEAEADRIQAVVDELIDRAETLTRDEEDLLLLLGTLIERWEGDKYELPGVPPHEIVQALIESHQIRQKDLVGPVFPTEGLASEVLHGKRRLTYDFVQRLAAYFHVSPEVFFDAVGENS